MRTGGEGSDSVVVTQISTRMAPAPAGGRSSTEGSARTTFVVGKITRRRGSRSQLRSIEPTVGLRPARSGGAETVH